MFSKYNSGQNIIWSFSCSGPATWGTPHRDRHLWPLSFRYCIQNIPYNRLGVPNGWPRVAVRKWRTPSGYIVIRHLGPRADLVYINGMGLLPYTWNCGLRMRWECRERFPHHRLQRKPPVSDPSIHHGTCVTNVPWCMSGSLTRCGG